MVLRLRSSITAKMTLLVLLGATAVFAFILAYGNYIIHEIIRSDAETGAKYRAESVASKMDAELRSVAEIAETVAYALQYGDWNEETMNALMFRVVGNNEQLYGSAVAFEEHAFRPELRAYAPYFYRSGSGVTYEQLASSSYNYFVKDWYFIPREMKSPVWSAPYFDEGGGNALMTTFSLPFFDLRSPGETRKIKGIVTVDLTLDGLTQKVEAVRVKKTGYAFLVSDQGQFLAHPQKDWIMRESIFSLAEEWNRPRLREIGRQMLRERMGFLDIGDVLGGKASFLAFARLPSTGWSLGLVFPEDELFAEVNSLNRTIMLQALVGVGLLLGVSFLVARSIARPLRRMAQATRRVAEGDLEIDVTEPGRQDEVGQLGQAFTRMAQDLKNYIRELTETTAAKQRIESELSIAARIQKSMLPSRFPAFPERDEFDIHAVMRPAKEVGGDLYDFFLLDDNRLCMVVGDVSGKGVPAALFMAVTKYLIEATSGSEELPDEVLSRVNGQLARNNESCMFVTIFLGILNLTTGELVYASGGHNPPLLLSPEGEADFLATPGGPIVGVMDDAVFGTDKLALKPGSVLLAYSDGVTEAFSADGEAFSEERLHRVAQPLWKKPVEEITDLVMNEIDSFCDGAPQADDITILALRFDHATRR